MMMKHLIDLQHLVKILLQEILVGQDLHQYVAVVYDGERRHLKSGS